MEQFLGIDLTARIMQCAPNTRKFSGRTKRALVRGELLCAALSHGGLCARLSPAQPLSASGVNGGFTGAHGCWLAREWVLEQPWHLQPSICYPLFLAMAG